MLDDFRDNEDDLNKGEEFLDEFRQRLNSQPLENLEDRKNDINKSQHVFLGTILGIGLAGIVSWFILAPDYQKAEDADIPVVRRPQTTIKVQPSEPGGMEILNQDKTVYDMVEKKSEEETVTVENLLPPPEEPIVPVIAETSPKEEVASTEETDVVKTAEKIIATAEQEKIKEAKPTEKETATVEVEKESSSVDVQTPKQEVKVEVKKEIKEQIEVKKEVASNDIPVGSWQIQLISSPNKSTMEKAWKDLTQKYKALENLPHEIESADLGKKGTFYRLKAGSYKDRTEADKICNAIKASGGSCLVKKK